MGRLCHYWGVWSRLFRTTSENVQSTDRIFSTSKISSTAQSVTGSALARRPWEIWSEEVKREALGMLKETCHQSFPNVVIGISRLSSGVPGFPEGCSLCIPRELCKTLRNYLFLGRTHRGGSGERVKLWSFTKWSVVCTPRDAALLPQNSTILRITSLSFSNILRYANPMTG